MAETKKEEFICMVQQFMSFIFSSQPQFANYFRTTYLKKVEEWLTCHRVGTLVNTNMHIKAFHRVLKYIYLNGKQNRRVEHLLHILL